MHCKPANTALFPPRAEGGGGYSAIKVTGVLVVPFRGFITILQKGLEKTESVRKFSSLLLKFAVPVILFVVVELVPLRGENEFGTCP